MLAPFEKTLFAIALLLTTVLGWRAAIRIIRIIGRGSGRPEWSLVPRRLIEVAFKILTFSPVFKTRFITSLFHGLVGWGFMLYALVNIGDVLQGYIPDFVFLGRGTFGNLYRLASDALSVAVMIGMLALMIRRFIVRPEAIAVRQATALHPKARAGIKRDSAIVGLFILLHVGFRFLGESFHLATVGIDPWQPMASALSKLWTGSPASAIETLRHLSWWLALGLVLAFIPYFPHSKHIHLFFAPINYLLRPERRSIGELAPLDFEDESIEQFGAARLEDLSWSALMDAYACIMCNRCQEACPAYGTGKVLSPAALEINKRYFINREAHRLASGDSRSQELLEFAITEEAIWGCVACGACVEICPVGNEPMRDILHIRRHLVLMENRFPELFQTAYRGMERAGNPWSIGPENRLAWAKGLQVPTVEENPDFDLLWWVGCAPASDPRAQQTARAFFRILKAAHANFAVLGPAERCTGDAARRSGNEYLFCELATRNVETLDRIRPKRIVTTCPHCLHTLKNEYPAFGGHYPVIHHTELMQDLIRKGRLEPDKSRSRDGITFHDPCYLGRMNRIFQPPRQALRSAGIHISEMPHRGSNSFCCGAGGAQMWKEEEHGEERVSAYRLREAQNTGAETLVVGCPFCMIMLSDAAGSNDQAIEILDVAEIIAQRIE